MWITFAQYPCLSLAESKHFSSNALLRFFTAGSVLCGVREQVVHIHCNKGNSYNHGGLVFLFEIGACLGGETGWPWKVTCHKHVSCPTFCASKTPGNKKNIVGSTLHRHSAAPSSSASAQAPTRRNSALRRGPAAATRLAAAPCSRTSTQAPKRTQAPLPILESE